ncbi:MAG: HEAT repeat domain-containing protein [Spirochaetia bacterium]|jgi:HEAT repeat protein|nr:HEAT repeat domain-containing protein [Spirochaetia bacterium]
MKGVFDYMQNIVQTMGIPRLALVSAAPLLAAAGLCLYFYVRGRVFKTRLKRIVLAAGEAARADALRDFARRYPPEKLLRHSRRMEKYARQWGPQALRETGLARLWTERLAQSPLKAGLRRVLLYCPPECLFTAFLAVQGNPALSGVFFDWVQQTGEEKVIRLLADSCKGEDFDAAFAWKFLENQKDLLRELTGDPEWHARYFAYKVLLLDREERTRRSLEDGLADPHPLIRRILVENFIADDRDAVYARLWDSLVRDPAHEVRAAAKKRILKSFPGHYSLKDKTLEPAQAARVLELLDPGSQEDRAFAMGYLESQDRELRYPAAAFLEQCGTLGAILARASLDDPAGMERDAGLLRKALEVNVCAFLDPAPAGAPLLAAARVLGAAGAGPQTVCRLAEKVFAFFRTEKPEAAYQEELYTKTLESLAARGGGAALDLFARELSSRAGEPSFLRLLLPRIPRGADYLFLPILLRFLKDPAFAARKDLVSCLGGFDPSILLPELFRILGGSRADNPHSVRISALEILGKLKLPYCLQRILESLPTLRPEEAEEFAHLVAAYPREMFEEKAAALFASPDARIRASLITILPATRNQNFMKEIRAALKDADPDVRVAAIKALLAFGEVRLLNQETSMLRDPVQRVRLATARVIAGHGNPAAMEILKTVALDPDETDTVRVGVIESLGQADNEEGLAILAAVLDSQPDFRACAEKALTNRTSKRDLIQLVEIFKDSGAQMRDKLIPVFRGQGEKAEPRILEILKDEIPSIKPYLARILEETGYVDQAIRRLSHRDVETRREAARWLSLLDTLPAFRGLVLAAKDPDQEVRVLVVKALEKLKTPGSRDTLEKLKEDPDSRIRKYTHWALERLDSLGME